MTDPSPKNLQSIEAQLVGLAEGLPKGRTNLSEAEKDALLAKLGVQTLKSLLKAKAQLPHRRIPFLFSSLDTQAVADVLVNDWTAALQRANVQSA